MGRITIGRHDSDEFQVIPSKPKVEKYDDSEIKMQLNEIIKAQNKLEKTIKLIKLFIPITLAIAVIGLFI